MNPIEKVFEKVKPINHSICNKYDNNKIRIKDKNFTIKSVYKILEHLKWMQQNGDNRRIKIIIDSECFIDQGILTLFESIIFFVINNWNEKISYRFEIKEHLLGYQIFKKSILYKYNNTPIDVKEYSKGYQQKLVIDKEHFRKICNNTKENREGDFLSKTMGDIDTFFKTFDIDNEYREQLVEVIVEILDNSLKHANSDCILNIHVLKSKFAKYQFIDVSVVSIDNISFGSRIKEYIYKNDKSEYSKKNEIILTALENHKQYFNEQYTIDNFCAISAFQKYVTTREKARESCGTGLTRLINVLINGASENLCYAITGTTNIIFKKEFLNLDNNGLIGFNGTNDYINEIPDQKVVSINQYDVNANIYNLQFMFKENLNNGR